MTTQTMLAAPADADARFWDRIARKYAAGSIADPAGYETTIARTAALIGDLGHVLETGCGTGTTALRLAGHVGHITATDISPAMIAIARERLAESGASNVSFEVAPSGAEPTTDGGGYDAVLAFNVLHLVQDLDDTLSHLRAVLKPGGLLICKTPCLAEMNPLIRRVMIPVMQMIGKAPHVLSFTSGELAGALRRHGFGIIANERHASKGKDTRPFLAARAAS
jgi:ubiquinone/menaquinone biosynthesis C-methylase UbiE